MTRPSWGLNPISNQLIQVSFKTIYEHIFLAPLDREMKSGGSLCIKTELKPNQRKTQGKLQGLELSRFRSVFVVTLMKGPLLWRNTDKYKAPKQFFYTFIVLSRIEI